MSRYPNEEVERFDQQFAESEDERNERLRMKRLARSQPDPRDPDYSREGIFQTHNCWKCKDGSRPCASGSPRQCEYPHARND